MLAVEVDSTERPDIPPFGDEVDYLTFGGIYREVSLRVVPDTFIENVFAAPKNVMTQPAVDVKCYLEHPATASHEHYSLTAEVLDGDRVLGTGTEGDILQQAWRMANCNTRWRFRTSRRSSCGTWIIRSCITCAFA